jgi:hypothetical protein
MPKLGLTAEEIAESKAQSLAWGLETGAVREIVQAYRRARHRGDGELTALNQAAEVAKALGRPGDRIDETARVLIDWAIEHHRDWFYEFELRRHGWPR